MALLVRQQSELLIYVWVAEVRLPAWWPRERETMGEASYGIALQQGSSEGASGRLLWLDRLPAC